jgi:Condensation domain
MTVRVRYRGYTLDFTSLPSPDQILRSYEELRQAVVTRINKDASHSIPNTPRNLEVPLSFIQESLWLQEQVDPGSAAYNLPAAVRLTGELNIKALSNTITELIRRHEILRTAFPTINGLPRQVIAPPVALEFPVTVLSGASSAELDRAVREEISAPFNLEKGPLFRSRLLALSEADHVFVMTFHHLVYDAWSASILMREIAHLYDAYSRGTEPSLPELPLQYADFSAWQRQTLGKDILQEALRYWREHLAGAPSLLEIPTDFPRSSVSDASGARHAFRFPSDLTAGLKALARQESVTLFSLMLAVYQILLAKYSHQEDIVVGVPVADRTQAGLENLIGCFINILPVRTRTPGRLLFRELLLAVQSTVRKVVSYQAVPFAKIVQEIVPVRDALGTPIYQTLFDFINTPQQPANLSTLAMAPITTDTGAAKMDLLVDMWEADGQLVGQFEYRTCLFKPQTIANMARSFETLSRNSVDWPGSQIGVLAIRTPEEEHRETADREAREELNRQKLMSILPKIISV